MRRHILHAGFVFFFYSAGGRRCSATATSGDSVSSSATVGNAVPFSLLDVMSDVAGAGRPVEEGAPRASEGNSRSVAAPHGRPFPLPTAYSGYRKNSPERIRGKASLYGSPAAAAVLGNDEEEHGKEEAARHGATTVSASSAPLANLRRAHGTPEDIKRVVREAVLEPLGGTDSSESATASRDARAPKRNKQHSEKKDGKEAQVEVASVSAYPLTVRIADKFGMPAELPRGAPGTLDDLMQMCSSHSTLKEQLQRWVERNRVAGLTQTQQSAIPFALEYRDMLCIAPTATGKTFAYVFPTMLRLAMDEAAGLNTGSPSSSSTSLAYDGAEGKGENPGREGSATAFGRRDVEALLREKISKGEVCRYCELSVVENPICPMTGVPHPPPPSEVDVALNAKARRAMRLEELSSIAEPRVLILVPTSQLAFQVYNVCKAFHADYTIRYMVRASSAEEQKRFLAALEGTDVLVSTPETILPALYKHKLSLKRVKTLIFDEVDDLVSVNHFEKVKIILGALPRGAERPQRLLFGASLPPVAYNMLKEKLLLPSHRFVLADVAKDHLGHPVQQGVLAAAADVVEGPATASRQRSRSDAARSSSGGVLTTPSNGSLTHVVFMLGRVEKVQKLAWLYERGHLTFDQRTIIFCNSRHNVAYVHDQLKTLVPQVNVTTLTSRASVTAREGVLRMFASGVSTCLVCTDLLSRGIDFKGVMYVVHFDMPLEMETWVHRNGRCGRSGLPGYVYSFFQPENIRMAKPLVAYLRQNKQLIPPKLQEYAKQPFLQLFNKLNFHHPTRPYRRDDPQNTTPVLGRGTPRFPDYRQEGIRKNFRPL